jgi:hypothetical protein
MAHPMRTASTRYAQHITRLAIFGRNTRGGEWCRVNQALTSMDTTIAREAASGIAGWPVDGADAVPTAPRSEMICRIKPFSPDS